MHSREEKKKEPRKNWEFKKTLKDVSVGEEAMAEKEGR